MRGFSLIELMVVIAIVALLAAVSLPAYKDYVTRTKIASVMPVAEALMNRSIEYYDINGVWPTAEDLGYTATNSVFVTDPTDVHPWLNIAIIGITNICTSTETYGRVQLLIDANQVGYTEDTNQVFPGPAFGLSYIMFQDSQGPGITKILLESASENPFATSRFFASDNAEFDGVDLNAYIEGFVCP